MNRSIDLFKYKYEFMQYIYVWYINLSLFSIFTVQDCH